MPQSYPAVRSWCETELAAVSESAGLRACVLGLTVPVSAVLLCCPFPPFPSCSAFAPAALKEFVRNLRYEPVQPVSDGKLGEVETLEPWDGQDAAVEMEDEFSLDDIMGGDDDKTEL